MNVPSCSCLRLVLGDQLNLEHSWFDSENDDVLYVLAELHQEAAYVRHHVQKIAAFFLAMNSFASTLEDQGHRVLYLDLDDTASFEDLEALVLELAGESGASRFEYQRPDEYRLVKQLEGICDALEIETACCDSEHFLLPFDEIGKQFEKGTAHRMEAFYRRMRRNLDILVDSEGEPEGGEWNYDEKNRKKLPKDQSLPSQELFGNDTSEVLKRIRRHEVETIGNDGDGKTDWPVNREQSLSLLTYFLEHGLPLFGPYQDAMTTRGWALFHSRLSFSMNTKMLSPAEVVSAVLDAWKDNDSVSLPSVEGFVRQIIGWREYMRGMYWANLPGYASQNELDHERDLPDWYWSGDTRMACVAHAIGQSLDHSYAHHIQRLMVTGNFALLAGVDPKQVDQWYLGIYADAIEWVEMPNTRGMSQFADGGLVASKPYCSSGQYIKRMSDYCGDCHYKVGQRTGEQSCPFNSLYWHFLSRHESVLSSNPRMAMPYRNWEKMDKEKKQQILETAENFLSDIENL